MNANEQLITSFYTAFKNKDYKGMQACYADNVQFSDNAFPNLKGKQAGAMWHMLLSGAKDLQVAFSNVTANDKTGSADWVAVYTFTLTGNKVTNRIHAGFEFANGKIVKHTDSFDFYAWAKQAFGFKGTLLGWTGFFKNQLQAQTTKRLQGFIEKNTEYK